ncbi:aldehyde dehydrogenase family protein [Actinomadura madurae]|uniref:aldehyde dehydrogenase family protein n=1 Tax=Actinomadura madurae TaxID=1993 RepID=UPI0020D20620|nr:aldehyde dehydrogenase family protein [Actinomadura madurae]
MDAVTNVPVPVNEPVKGYAPGSGERAALEAKIKELGGAETELTMTIAGERRMGAGTPVDVVEPHNHGHVLGRMGEATEADVAEAIAAAREAAPAWRAMAFEDRAAILLRAADLLAARGGPR